MALSNYDELFKEVQDWSLSDDHATKFNTFLRLAEVEMQSNPDEPLSILSLDEIATTSTSTTSRFLSLPSGMNEARKITLTIDGYDGKVRYTAPGNLLPQENYQATPSQFTISNNQIEFNCIPDEEYTVTINYSVVDEPLTEDNQTNVVLSRYPNIYLFGCLSQVFSYQQDDQQASKFSGYFLQAIVDANKREKKIKYPTGLNIKASRVV